MKIVNSMKKKTVTFADLQAGDVFQSSANGCFYMKTDVTYDDYGDVFNTVHLESGSLHGSDHYMEVIPVDCELVIK